MLWYNPCNSKHKYYVPPSKNHSFQELQFYFGYKHTKVVFMVGEEPHVRPQAESLLCRNIPRSTLLPKWLASQAAALPKQLHDIRAQGKPQTPCGSLGCFRSCSPGTGTQRQTETHSNCVSLATASTTGSLCIQDNFPGTTCDSVVTPSPCRTRHSTSEHAGSAQSTLEVL